MLYLIRHGHGRHNETKDYDNPKFVDAILTQKGKEQSKNLRAISELKNPDIVISSPLSRAFETACLAFPESKIEIDSLCREKQNFMCDRMRPELESGLLRPETTEEINNRANLFLEKLHDFRGKKIVVVTHSKFMSVVMKMFNLTKEHKKYYENTEILKIKWT